MPVALSSGVISVARRQLLRAFSIAILALLACSTTLSAQTLMWNANSESNLSGYIVQYGTQSGSPSTSIDVGNVTSRTMTGLTAGSTYYFRVVAYNSTGQQSSPSSQVSYTVPTAPVNPTITAVSPTSGPTAGGTQITVTGTNFVSGATVRVGGTAATNVVFVGATQLTARTPAGTTGARDVVVTNPGGQSATRAGAFTYTAAAAPALTSVSPTSGPTAGGTTITLTGTNFVSGATVRVGGTAATNVVYVGATQLTARTPAGTAGARDVVVTNPDGQASTRTGGFTYTGQAAAPTLTAVSPSSGSTAGGTTVTLTGTGFVSGAVVRIGGSAATNVTFVSATQVTARTAAATEGPKDVRITNPDGQAATRSDGFTYTAPASSPTLTSVSPNTGPTAGGTTITLTGSNFVSGATVRVGGTTATTVTFYSATQLTARTPAGTAGARDVVVTNPAGQSGTLTGGFTYTTSTRIPTITSISPASGPTSGGTSITVTGTNFSNSYMQLTIGGVSVTDLVSSNGTTLTARTPAGTAGARDVVVTNRWGLSVTRSGGFTYDSGTVPPNTPIITSVSPASGPTSGGTLITVRGTSFTSRAMTLIIGGRAATNVVSTNNTTLTAVTPSGTAGVRDIVITNGWGRTSTYAGGFTYGSSQTLSQAAFSSYLAEGVESDQMNTQLALANSEDADTRVELTFMTSAGATVQRSVDVPARSRRTLDLSTVPELAGTSFSTTLESDRVVGLDRRLSLDAAGQASTVATAVDKPSATWHFSGAPTADPFEQFYLVQNPGDTDTEVEVRYLPTDGAAPIVRTQTVAAHSRATIWVDRTESALSATTVGASITSLDGSPIVVERTVYVTEAGSAAPRSGVTQAGSTTLAAPAATGRETRARWLVASGEPGARQAAPGVVVTNEGAATDVTVTLLFEDGPEATASFAVAAGAQFEVPLAQAFPTAAGRSFSVLIEGADPTATLTVSRGTPRADATGSVRAASTGTRLP